MTTATRETCSAGIGWYATDSAIAERRCGQTVGIGFLTAPDGTRLAYCSREGHKGRVERLAQRLHGVVPA